MRKSPFIKKMDLAYNLCPGVTMGRMPTTDQSLGELLISPGCARAALDFLKRRFHVKEEVSIEATGELKLVIQPRVRRKGVRSVKPTFAKQIQYELPLQ